MVPISEPDEAGRLFEVPLDPQLKPVDHGFPPAGPGVIPGGAVLSPDGTRILQLVERPPGLIADLMLADFPTGSPERLIAGLPLLGHVWWSPDGQTIGYLVDVQSPEQGIWLANANGTELRKLVGGALVMGREAWEADATLWKVWQPRP